MRHSLIRFKYTSLKSQCFYEMALIWRVFNLIKIQSSLYPINNTCISSSFTALNEDLSNMLTIFSPNYTSYFYHLIFFQVYLIYFQFFNSPIAILISSPIFISFVILFTHLFRFLHVLFGPIILFCLDWTLFHTHTS